MKRNVIEKGEINSCGKKRIIELFIVLTLFFFFPIAVMPYALYKVSVEKEKHVQVFYLALFCVAMGFLAFHTVPLKSDDLCRHYENMKILQYTGFPDFFHSSYEFVYLNTLIMTICAKLGVYQLYPMFYVTIGYGLLFYAYIRLVENRKLTKIENISIVMFMFFAVNCRDFISGLRNYFSFIICMYLIVSEKVFHHKKIYTYLGILCASFIHTAALTFLIFELISELSKYQWIKKMMIISIFLTIPALIIVSKGVFPFVPHEIVRKLDMYISDAYINNLNVYIFQVGIVVLLGSCHLFNRKKSDLCFKSINDFLDFYLVFMLSIIPIMIFLSRFIFFLVAISPIILIQTFIYLGDDKNKKLCLLGILMCFIGAGILMLLASIRAYPWHFDLKNIFIWGYKLLWKKYQ